jgi:hypothetical protein
VEEIFARIDARISAIEERMERARALAREKYADKNPATRSASQDQAAIYDASVLCFRRARDELAALKREISRIVSTQVSVQESEISIREEVLEGKLDSFQEFLDQVPMPDTDRMDEWELAVFDENGSHADPLVESPFDSYAAILEYAGNIPARFPGKQLRIVLMRVM